MRAALLACLAAAAAQAGPPAPAFRDEVRASAFLKGSLHAHSDRSDGDSPPEAVLAWYAARGYSFAALTDHDRLVAAPAPGIVAVRGVEVTSRAGRPGRMKPVHVNALCAARGAAGETRETPASALAGAIGLARQAGARIVVINHPSWTGALSGREVAAATGWDAIEIASGHPLVERDDASASESAEDMWDAALAAGREVHAIAADDAHDFDGTVKPGEPGLRAPGRAWVGAWGAAGSEASVCEALAAGRYYASTGAGLRSLVVAGGAMTVTVEAWDAERDSVEFVVHGGRGRRVVRVAANPARYALEDGDRLVRARVLQARGKAWTQAYRTTSP